MKVSPIMSTKAIERDHFAHFLEAQDGGIYERALEEIAAGEKVSHWMWFIFPQLARVGSSAASRKFALSGTDEAQAYTRHEELGARLFEATEAMLEWAGTMSAADILGEVDAQKFRSSMTLFEAACENDEWQVFTDALEGFFGGERCRATLANI